MLENAQIVYTHFSPHTHVAPLAFANIFFTIAPPSLEKGACRMPQRGFGIFLGKDNSGCPLIQRDAGGVVRASHSTFVLTGDLETGTIVGSCKPPRPLASDYARVEYILSDTGKLKRWKVLN